MGSRDLGFRVRAAGALGVVWMVAKALQGYGIRVYAEVRGFGLYLKDHGT